MGAFAAPLTGHLSVALTNYAKGFRQNGLFSDIVAPRVQVGRQTDYYYIWDRSDQMLNFQDLRATGDPAQRVRRSVSTSSYNAKSHALAGAVPDETRANAEQAGIPQLTSQMGVTAFLQKKILLKKEYRWASMMTTTNVTNNTTLAGSDQWTSADSTPAGPVATGKKVIRRAGVNPNLMIIGEDAYAAAVVNPHILNSFKYTQKGVIGLAELAAYFDVERVELAGAIQVTADSTQTASVIFDADDVLLCYVDPNANNEDISFMKTFVWAGAPGTIGGYGVVVGRDPDPTAKTDVIGVDFYYDQVITSVEAGYLFKNAA